MDQVRPNDRREWAATNGKGNEGQLAVYEHLLHRYPGAKFDLSKGNDGKPDVCMTEGGRSLTFEVKRDTLAGVTSKRLAVEISETTLRGGFRWCGITTCTCDYYVIVTDASMFFFKTPALYGYTLDKPTTPMGDGKRTNGAFVPLEVARRMRFVREVPRDGGG